MIKDAQALRTIEQDILMRESLSHIGLKVKGIILTAVLVESKQRQESMTQPLAATLLPPATRVWKASRSTRNRPVKPVKRWCRDRSESAGRKWNANLRAGGVGQHLAHGYRYCSFFREIQEKTGKESDFRHLKTPWMYVNSRRRRV